MSEELMKPCACPQVVVSHNQKDTGLIITVPLPGVKKEDIDLTVGTHNFCVTGEREDIKYDGCYQLVHDVNTDKIDAKFENGLLLVEVPFKEPLRGKKVEIH